MFLLRRGDAVHFLDGPLVRARAGGATRDATRFVVARSTRLGDALVHHVGHGVWGSNRRSEPVLQQTSAQLCHRLVHWKLLSGIERGLDFGVYFALTVDGG